MGCCPTCGQDIPHLQVFVDLNSQPNRVCRFGWEARITPLEAELLVALMRVSPSSLAVDRAAFALWGSGEWPDSYRGALQVLVCKLRKKLKPMGLEIRTRKDALSRELLGYSLHSDPEHLRMAKRLASQRGAA